MTKSNRGGKRPGAGRPKGALNRATIENKANIEALAREHTELALNTLVAALSSESDTVRIAAATAILDRGYGKPRQSVEATVDVNSNNGAELERAEARIDSLVQAVSGLGGAEHVQEQPALPVGGRAPSTRLQ